MRCDRCNQIKPDVKFRVDPRRQLLYGIEINMQLCDECERAKLEQGEEQLASQKEESL